MPALNDTGATCSCITEERAVLTVNHTQRMLSEGLISVSYYSYPIVHIYCFEHAAHLKGAEKSGRMPVEYAVVLRIEFISEGSGSGPVKGYLR